MNGSRQAAQYPRQTVSVSHLLFLALFAKPFGEKLGRIRLKYDI